VADIRNIEIVDLWVNGWSYAAIGREYGIGRERVRQIVADDSEAKDRKANRARELKEHRRGYVEQIQTQAFLARLQEVIDQDLHCAACGGWVIRDITSSGDNKTCSPECAEAWSVLRSFPEVAGDDHRIHMANAILRRPSNYKDSQVEWAQRMIEDAPPPNRRWVQKGSKRAEILKRYRPELYQRLVDSDE
jgi:hypothetical protein